jgi:hypothetical protein
MVPFAISQSAVVESLYWHLTLGGRVQGHVHWFSVLD